MRAASRPAWKKCVGRNNAAPIMQGWQEGEGRAGGRADLHYLDQKKRKIFKTTYTMHVYCHTPLERMSSRYQTPSIDASHRDTWSMHAFKGNLTQAAEHCIPQNQMRVAQDVGDGLIMKRLV